MILYYVMFYFLKNICYYILSYYRMLYCIILFYIVLYYIILYYIIFYYIILYYIVLYVYYILLYYIILYIWIFQGMSRYILEASRGHKSVHDGLGVAELPTKQPCIVLSWEL